MRPGIPENGAERKNPRRLRAVRGRRREGANVHASLREALLALLASMGGTPERAGLQRLWDNWEKVLGPELAGMAQPLGHHAARGAGQAGAGHGVTLLLGAEDAMLLQELRFRGGEILERVNGFLGHAYFCEVKVSLPLGRSEPVRSCETAPARGQGEAAGTPAARGIFLAGMDSDSPVARCYARFARLAVGAGEKAAGKHEKKNKK